MKQKLFYILKISIIIALMLLSTLALVFSLSYLVSWEIDTIKINKQVDELQDIGAVDEIKDDNVEIIQQEEKIEEFDPYWNYIDMGLISADFADLNEINPDTAGWIKVNGTNIDYPYVQTTNNNYYLTHSFTKSVNSAGWVFLDYRNNPNLTHKNNILYAHGRFDGTMFGTLKNILSSKWIENPDNYVIKLSTESENTLWQIFSIYRIPTTSDYLQIEFSSDTQFLEFSNMLLERSDYDFNTKVLSTDKILTLSTCYNDDEKVVLHAKLIKRSVR